MPNFVKTYHGLLNADRNVQRQVMPIIADQEIIDEDEEYGEVTDWHWYKVVQDGQFLWWDKIPRAYFEDARSEERE